MKTFIVTKEEYTRHGQSGDLTTKLYKAEDVDDLILQLDPGIAEDQEFKTELLDTLREMNGDGYDYYMIYELVKGPKGENLVTIL